MFNFRFEFLLNKCSDILNVRFKLDYLGWSNKRSKYRK